MTSTKRPDGGGLRETLEFMETWLSRGVTVHSVEELDLLFYQSRQKIRSALSTPTNESPAPQALREALDAAEKMLDWCVHEHYAPDNSQEKSALAKVRNAKRLLVPAPQPPVEGLREALKTAIDHIEHMAAWITAQKAGYSFESLGEDMPDIRAALASPSLTAGWRGSPSDIRALGWSVAVHNDYAIKGDKYTFWLFTKDGVAIKGEGRNDALALDEVRAAINRLSAPATLIEQSGQKETQTAKHTSSRTEASATETAADAERERCAAIVQMARFGEIDQDFRAIISIIEGGMTIDQIKEFCT